MKRFFRNSLVFLILVSLLAGSVLADGIMPLADTAIDSSLVEIAEDQFNELVTMLDTVPSELKTGWTTSYPYAMAGSWYNRVINLLTDIKSNTSGSSGGSSGSGDPKLVSGWTSSYPTGYSSSWYYKVISLLNNIYSSVSTSGSSSIPSSLQSGWDFSNPSSLSSSWYKRVITEIDGVSSSLGVYVSSIDSSLLNHIGYLDLIHMDMDDLKDYVYFIMSSVSPRPYEDEIKQSQEDERQALYEALESDSRGEDIGSVFGLKQDFSDFFAVDGADVSQLFTHIETGSIDWFSSSTEDALSVGGGAVAVYSSFDDPVSDTPLLDQRISQINSYFTGGD